MTGRGDKGLRITSGTFTGDAARDGAPLLDLINSARLCELSSSSTWVSPRAFGRSEDVAVETAFFEGI